jgi:hypothetical protein
MNIFVKWRRLDARGRARSGLVVDEEGMMLGPECLLVRRMPEGYRCLDPTEATVVQKALFADSRDPDWLFRHCARIAAALARGEIALAQIYGLQIPLPDLDGNRLEQLARAASLVKAGFNPDEPRDWHGRWTGGGDTAQPEHEPHGNERPAGSAEDRADGLEIHLVEAGYALSPEIWRAVRGLYQILRNHGADIEAFKAYLEDRGLHLDELPAVVKSLFDPPRPLSQLRTTKPPMGFYTQRELLNYLGKPMPGYEWHHLIEQTGQYRPDLTSPEGIRIWIQNTNNVVQIPVIKHYCISALMSGRIPSGIRLRDAVRAHAPAIQRQIGIDLLRRCGVTP